MRKKRSARDQAETYAVEQQDCCHEWKSMNQSMDLGNWGALLLLSLLWGGSFFFVGVAVKALPPLTLVALRIGIAALALTLFLGIKGRPAKRPPRIWIAFAGMGLLNNILPFTLIAWGQTQIASGLASILNAATPIFAVVVAHCYTRDERLSMNRLLGVITGFVGVVLVIGPSLLQGLGGKLLPQVAVLCAAVSYAFAGVFGKRFARWGLSPVEAAAGQLSASTLLLFPLALVVEQSWRLPLPDPGVWGAVFSLALLSTALAYILYFRILASSGATNLLLVTLLIPVSAIALGALFLGERLEPGQIAGVLVIGLGLGVIDGRPLSWLRSRLSS